MIPDHQQPPNKHLALIHIVHNPPLSFIRIHHCPWWSWSSSSSSSLSLSITTTHVHPSPSSSPCLSIHSSAASIKYLLNESKVDVKPCLPQVEAWSLTSASRIHGAHQTCEATFECAKIECEKCSDQCLGYIVISICHYHLSWKWTGHHLVLLEPERRASHDSMCVVCKKQKNIYRCIRY